MSLLRSSLSSQLKNFIRLSTQTRIIPRSHFHTSRPLLRILPEMSDQEPTGLKADKGIELLTFGTPNGWKASILLEELKDAYGKDYTWQSINISKNTQKEPWFTKLGPNGRIP
jgi:glutathione S-transferase